MLSYPLNNFLVYCPTLLRLQLPYNFIIGTTCSLEHRAGQRWLVTRARVSERWNNDLTHLVGSVGASSWLARSKSRVEPGDLGEGLGLMVPSVEGTA